MIDMFPKRHYRVVDLLVIVPDCMTKCWLRVPFVTLRSLVNDRISFEVPTQPAAVSLVRLSVTQVARGVDGTCFGSRLPIDELAVVSHVLSVMERCGQPYRKDATDENKLVLLDSGTEHLGSSPLPSL